MNSDGNSNTLSNYRSTVCMIYHKKNEIKVFDITSHSSFYYKQCTMNN